jgi:hypothetical protein
VNGKTAQFSVTVNAIGAPTLTSIAVTTPPTKTTYVKGEDLDLTGIVVTGTYSDGNTKMEDVGEDNVSGYDADTIGEQTLTVTVSDKTARFSVTVNAVEAPTLTGIVVTTPPTKTTYTVGEELDLSGLVVTGTYSDNTTKAETVTTANVSGYGKYTVGGQELTVTVNGKTAQFSVTVNAVGAPTLTSIVVTSPPTKTTYAIGEALDLTGIVVTGTYSDGNTKTEDVGEDNVSGYDADTIGEQTLTVTVSGKTAQFSVTVNAASAPTLTSIVVTSPPTKTTYDKGEDLDLTGIVVTGTYSDNTTKAETVTTANVSGYNTNTLGEQILTVTLNSKTTQFSVTVSEPTLQSIEITTAPTKTAYFIGEALDLTGLVVTGTYSNNSTKTETVNADNVSGYNADTAGTQMLTISISGKTAQFSVTVSEPTLQSIEMTTAPTKTAYFIGEVLDLTGLVVTGTYSNNSTKTETVSASNVSGYNADTAGTQTLTISISGKTAQFSVTVSEPTLQSIVVTTAPAKTTYAKGEALDLTGLVVTGTYSDNSTKTETVNADNITGYNANSTGIQTLTVTIDGKTATFTVRVQASAPLAVNFDDPINGIPTNIVLSKSGATASVALEIIGAYASYAWRLNDKTEAVSTTAAYTLNAADCPMGKNFLTVEVKTSAGRYYSKEITFIVNK